LGKFAEQLYSLIEIPYFARATQKFSFSLSSRGTGFFSNLYSCLKKTVVYNELATYGFAQKPYG